MNEKQKFEKWVNKDIRQKKHECILEKKISQPEFWKALIFVPFHYTQTSLL